LLRIEVQTSYNVQELSAALRDWAGVNEPQPALQADTGAALRSEVASTPAPALNVAQKASSPPANGAPPTHAPPACPKCGQPMVLRVVKKEGPYKGNKFWGCQDFPRCRGVREYVPQGGG
jgi:restriction system protein